MRYSLLSLSLLSLSLASLAPFPQGKGKGADSCPSQPLTQATWTSLKIDDVLASEAKTYKRTKTNNIQSYAAVAVQNWNNYMNSLSTSISFASSILSLRLSQIVSDVMPNPIDNVTPLKDIGTIFGAILGMVPFTGPVQSAAGLASSGLGFVLSRVQPPQPADKFLAWSNVGGSMADIVQEYQGIVSETTQTIIDAPIDDPKNGINLILQGGGFLGDSQNFTQQELQAVVIDGVTRTALGMALQAQKIFVTRFFNRATCNDGESNDVLCRGNGGGSSTVTIWSLLRADDKNNAQPQTAVADALVNKYGFTKDQMLKGVTDCYDGNNKRQLASPLLTFGAIPVTPTAMCVFNILVCDIDTAAGTNNMGVVDYCRSKGVPV
ncbi:hypothetical protein ACEQ8H_008801 [Pleosporales sp. CAS-2024a]